MAEVKKHSRAARILLSIAVVIIIILSGFWVGQRLIASKITNLLEKGPISLDGKSYISDIGKVRVDFTRRSISLSDVILRTDDTRNTQDGPAVMLDLRIQKITASGLRYRKGNRNAGASLYIRHLAIDSPKIIYEGAPKPEKRKEEHERKHSDFAGLIIKRLTIADANLRINTWKDAKKSGYAVKGLNLEISDVSLGSPNIKVVPALHMTKASKATISSHNEVGKRQKPHFSSIKLTADGASYILKNGAIILAADTLSIDSKEGRISIRHLAIKPQYSKLQYNEKVGDHSDWIYVDMSGINLSGVRLPGIGNNEESLYADALDVDQALLESYKNRNQPQSPRIKPLLYQSIERLPLGIDLPKATIRTLNVHYEEVTPGETAPGRIDFIGLSVNAKGLTNRPKTREQQYTITASGLLLDKGRIDAVLTMPADSLNDHFSVRAKLGAMSAESFNQITVPMANIRITSGEIHSAHIMIEGNSNKAESRVEFLYDDLKVAILNKKKHDRERELLTFIANDIVIRRNNPERDKQRSGEGEFERNPQKSFWNYIWKTSFAGLKKVVM